MRKAIPHPTDKKLSPLLARGSTEEEGDKKENIPLPSVSKLTAPLHRSGAANFPTKTTKI